MDLYNKSSAEDMSKRRGGSNAGKYKGVKRFAGPAGGAPAGSYPINTKARCRAAIAYAHNAPNPEGIKRAARAQLKRLGG